MEIRYKVITDMDFLKKWEEEELQKNEGKKKGSENELMEKGEDAVAELEDDFPLSSKEKVLN
jgi:hypothetical protein